MKERLRLFLNGLLFILATLLFASIQTSLWFQVFGYFPAPALWIPILVHLSVHRSFVESEIMILLICFALSSMTVTPINQLIPVCLALGLSVRLFRERISWASNTYVMMLSGVAALMFHVLHFAVTWVVGEQPMTSPQFLDWLIEGLLTPLAAPVISWFCVWIDQLTQKELPVETSA